MCMFNQISALGALGASPAMLALFFAVGVASSRSSCSGLLTRRSVAGQALAAASFSCLRPARPAAAADVRDAPPGAKLSKAEIEKKLRRTTVSALVNPNDEPYLTGGNKVGYFFLDPREAMVELRVLQQSSPEAALKVVPLSEVYFPLVMGEQGDLGGELRVRPSRRQVVMANRALAASSAVPNQLLPTSLDEQKGQVPVFYSERVSMVDGAGQPVYPFYLAKEDLDAAFVALRRQEGAPSSSTSERERRREAEADGIPPGLTRVATLDGLVKQMRSGEVDLAAAVIVGGSEETKLAQRLVAGE